VLDWIALSNKKIVTKALCTFRLRALRKVVVVLSSQVLSVAAVPADPVAQRCNGPNSVYELELAYFVQKLCTNVAVYVALACFSRTDGFGERKELLSLPYGPRSRFDRWRWWRCA
jgi:hypothetical protein